MDRQSPCFLSLHQQYLSRVRELFRLMERRAERRDDGEVLRRRRRRAVEQKETELKDEGGVQEERSNLEKDLENAFAAIEEMYREARAAGRPLFIDRVGQEFDLSGEERLTLTVILAAWMFGRRDRRGTPPHEVLSLICAEDEVKAVQMRCLFYADGKLRRHGLIRGDIGRTVCDSMFYVPERTIRQFLEEECLEDEDVREMEEADKADGKRRSPSGLLLVKTPEVDLDRVALSSRQREALEEVLLQHQRRDEIFGAWGFGERIGCGRAVSMLFYGPPGTGKTMTAEAVAGRLRRPLGIVEYSAVVSCWVGETEKNVVRVFRDAKEADCVLLFDECDALFNERMEARSAAALSENRSLNLLLQQVEAFDGVVILTTNREVALDPALERRISLRLRFDAPDATAREQVWRSFFGPDAPVSGDVDFRRLAERYALTGGEIKNAVMKAVRKCLARAGDGQARITQGILEAAAGEEVGPRWGRGERRVIGF